MFRRPSSRQLVAIVLCLVVGLGAAMAAPAKRAKLKRGDRVVVVKTKTRFDGKRGRIVGARRNGRWLVRLKNVRRGQRLRRFRPRNLRRVRRSRPRRVSPPMSPPVVPTPTPAPTWRQVSTPSELAAALGEAPPDTAIELRAGDYGDMTLDAARSAWVTVRPAPNEGVTFADLDFSRRASYIRVEGVQVNSRMDLEESGADHIQVAGTRNRGITARWGTHDLLFEGNVIDDPDTGIELISQNCTVHEAPGDCPAEDSLPPVERVVIRGNRISNPDKNGLTLTNFREVVVESNDISGLVEHGQHSDALQTFWGGYGLIVRRNYIHDNTGTQGIFLKDGRVANVTIEDNLIVRTGPRPGYNFSGPPLSFYDTVPDPSEPFYTGYGIRVVNNTIWDNRHVMGIMGPDNRQIYIHNNVTEGIILSETSRDQVRANGIDQDFNIVEDDESWGRVGPHDIAGPPQFRNRAGSDYRVTDEQAAQIGFRPGVTWAP